MNAGYIYKLTNKTNGKWYIGSRRFNVWFGVDIHDCIKDVQAVFQDNYFGSGKAIGRAINKYGKDNFIKEIICFHDDAYYQEAVILGQLGATDDRMSYNMVNNAKPPVLTRDKLTENQIRAKRDNLKQISQRKDVRERNSVRMRENNPMRDADVRHRMIQSQRTKVENMLQDLLSGKPGNYKFLHLQPIEEKKTGMVFLSDRYLAKYLGVSQWSANNLVKKGGDYIRISVDNFLKSSANLKYIPTAIRSQASETRKVQRLSPMGEYTVSAVEAEDTHVSG